MMLIVEKIEGLLKARQGVEAEKLAHSFLASHPENSFGWTAMGLIAQTKGDGTHLLSCAQKALAFDPKNLLSGLQEIEAYIQLSQLDQALNCLNILEDKAQNDTFILQHCGQFYNQLSDYIGALRCYNAAAKLAPNDPQAQYNLSTALSFTGDMVGAEKALNKVIELNPLDFDAYYNRSTLRKQNAERNHIQQLEALKKQHSSDTGTNPASVQICYALAKEYEDLGDYAASLENLHTGAGARRKMMPAYKVADDVETMQHIATAMDQNFASTVTQNNSAGPLFIVGLPRTGSTLLDRILSSHSAVETVGEVNDFAMAMMKAVGPAGSKADLIVKSSKLDFPALGKAYEKSIASRGHQAAFLIDKTPLNFLYIGLIAKALPNAKIIHMTRNPMDSGYAIYKTLFRMGYPFSYDLHDIARYYQAYSQLMQHWHQILPGRIIDVAYEDLVTDQEQVTRSVLAACDLPFEQACLSFHTNPTPTATASAAQVRTPIYRSSINKWHKIQHQLAPLSQAFKEFGIETEEPA